MPAKGKGKLQKEGARLAVALSQTIPFPFAPLTKEYWANIPYVSEDDYNFFKRQNPNSYYDTNQWRIIIKHTKALMK